MAQTRTPPRLHRPSLETTPVLRLQAEKYISAQAEEKILTAIAEGSYTFVAGAVQCLDDAKVHLPLPSALCM